MRTTALVSFLRAISAGVTSLMMSNATVPGLTTLPASMLPVAIGYLRHALGFHGLMMTDPPSAGVNSALHLRVPRASVDSLTTGADEVLNGDLASPAVAPTASHAAAAPVVALGDGRRTRAELVLAAALVLAATNHLRCAV